MEQQEGAKAAESAGRIKCAVLNISDACATADPRGRQARQPGADHAEERT